MTRPKTRSDEAVLDASLRLVLERGIDALTFASAATASGLSSATLVQRFGDKPTLRQRTLLRAWDLLDARTDQLAATTPANASGAVDLLVGLSDEYADLSEYSQGLLLLREDLRDPALRERGRTWERALVAAVEARFPKEPNGIGHALASHWQGAVIWWAFNPEGRLEDYLRQSLNDLLALIGARSD